MPMHETGAMDQDIARPPEPDRSLEGRRVLVTGHTGFKGAWLALWLDELGATVVGISDDSPPSGAFEALGVDDFVAGHTLDIRDRTAVSNVVTDAAPDLVFHLAAQPIVRASWVDPVATFETNVLGTVHVVEAALRTSSVRSTIVVTTDKVYENANDGRMFVEDDPLGGHDPYSASKAAAELALVPYRDPVHMGLEPHPIVSARAGNVIGGGDWAADRLLPDIVRALQSGGEVVLRRPDAVRPWQHVLDCLWGYLLLASATMDGAEVAHSYNFAHSSGRRSVLEVASLTADAWGAPRSAIRVERDESTAEAELLQLDATRAREQLGWSPKWTVEQAIAESVRFYRSDDAATTGREQLAEHMAATPVE